jgi:hypothetical protein
MKIVYLLGNGFDVNLELETKYTQFYEHYKGVDSKSDSIIRLKKSIENEDNWGDLELKFGEYTLEIASKEEFIEVFEDISDNLADYLNIQEDKVDSIEIEKEKFFEYLSFPERSLPVAQKNKVAKLRTKWANHEWNIYVITLNYTKTFEKLIGEGKQSLQIGSHGKPKINYQGIQHVHGYIDNAMVMGVNDISQLLNKKFHDVPEILNAFVKSQCNQAMQHTIDDQCKQHILTANLICIYGSSLGLTDKLWWETIGAQLKGDCHLIIFAYTTEIIPERREYKKDIIRENIKKSFLEKTNLTEKEKDTVYSKIFVGINRDLFKMVKNNTTS